MEEFTQDHSKCLLAKEWMAKVDTNTSTPYLLKYHCLPDESICLIMMTDTKKVWAEALDSKTMARRWRFLNLNAAEYSAVSIEENAWRKRVFALLSDAHTIGGIADLDFEVVDSNFSDLSLRIECDVFKWKWEMCFLGYQRSSEIISQHLIFPLISLTHFAFSSAEAPSELSDPDMEKSIDRVGRTARRTPDTHVKNAISKPVVATSIRRMSAIYHSAPDLPPVSSIAEKPYLHMEEPKRATGSSKRTVSARVSTPEHVREPEPLPEPVVEAVEPPPQPEELKDDSETEPDTDDDAEPSKQPESIRVDTPPPQSATAAAGDSDSSPILPAKKRIKKAVSSDDDSSSDKGKGSASGTSRGGGAKRGTRQPIKRGGKRF